MAGKKKQKTEIMVPVLGLQESAAKEARSTKKSEPDYAKLLMEDFVHPRGGVNERIDMDIKRHRMGWGRIVLSDKDGKPVSGAKIRLKQKTHEFMFGCNLFKLQDFETKKENAAYEKYFKKVFNNATVAFYWDTLEPTPGELRYTRDSRYISRRPPTDVAVDWCLENGIRPKGHWMFCDNFVPSWLPKSPREMMVFLEKRIAQLAERYGGKVTIWDAVNEAFSNNRWFSKNISWTVTPQDYVYEVFKLAEKYFPNYTELCYNDGNYVSYMPYARDNSPVFLLAKNLQMRGARLGGLGIQYHMFGPVEDHATNPVSHRYFDPYYHFKVLDQYCMLNIPLHMTETSFSTYPQLPRKKAEKLQADILHHFYRLWFSIPNMSSIVLWNFADNTAFGSENRFQAGILDKDLNPKPAYEELDRLIHEEWHTETTVETDERGIADWNGFYGHYDMEITVGRTVIKEDFQLASDGCNEIRKDLEA